MKIVDLRTELSKALVSKKDLKMPFDIHEAGKSSDDWVPAEQKYGTATVKHIDSGSGPGRVQVHFGGPVHPDVVKHLKSNGFKRVPNKPVWHAPLDGMRADMAAHQAADMHERMSGQLEKADSQPFHEAAFAKAFVVHPSVVKNPMQPLPQNHDKYFDLSKPHEVVPMHKLYSVKQQRPSTSERLGSVETAHHLMSTAAEGGGKRDPISVTKQADGRYHVEDGNATHGGSAVQ